jgi:hypothetical protein
VSSQNPVAAVILGVKEMQGDPVIARNLPPHSLLMQRDCNDAAGLGLLPNCKEP